MSLRISAAPMFKLLMPIAISVGLCAPMAWGQSTDTRVTPERSCPAAQPYCNNEWEVTAADGKRYWMARWAKSSVADIVTLRFPLEFIEPIGLINCSAFGKDFPQPSCQQPFNTSLLIGATYPDLQDFLGSKDVNIHTFDGRISILINSSINHLPTTSIDQAFIGSIDTYSRIGERKQYQREYKITEFGLTKIGPRRNIYGNEALGLRDIYYDGRDFLRSKNMISCAYDNSPVSNRRCTQIFMIREFNSIVKVTYGAEHLHQWENINYLVNEVIKSAAQER